MNSTHALGAPPISSDPAVSATVGSRCTTYQNNDTRFHSRKGGSLMDIVVCVKQVPDIAEAGEQPETWGIL